MKVFVTGEKGQLARCLADAAANDTTVDCIFAGRPEFDLANPVSVRAAISAARPDIVVNTAAYTAVDKAESESFAAFAVNRDGAAVVAAAAGHHNIPVIHISTDYVFAGDKTSAYTEADDVGPAGIYGQSKLDGEVAVRLHAAKHIILRTSWVYSVHGSNFVKTMLRLGRERPVIKVVDDQIGNPTSAHELAASIIALCHKIGNGETSWGTYHAAGLGDVTWYGFAKYIFSAAEDHGYAVPQLTPIQTREFPTPAKRPANSRLNCTKMRETFDLAMPNWQESTSACVDRLLRVANTLRRET
jgi:dTDP-4-dehydrorhamnose reductase